MRTGRRNWQVPALTLIGALLLGVLAAPGGADFKDPSEMEFPPLGKILTPEIERHVLESNGLVVHMVEDHDFPLVDYRIMVHVGRMYEPRELRGLAELTGEVLRTGGTSSIPGDELDERLESMGAFIESSIGGTEGTVNASFLTENAIEGLELLADVLRNPIFAEDKLELAKIEMRTEIASRNDEPLDIAIREYRKLMYGAQSPYGWHPEYETLEGIARDDLANFHRAYFHPDRMILTISGDFTAATMLAEVERIFGDWPSAGQPLPPDPEVPDQGSRGLFYAEKEGVTQSTVLFGHMGTLASDPDYAELRLLNQILGEGFSSRLMNEIRTKRGLAYAVGSGPGVGWHHRGTWMAYVLTQSESTLVSMRYLREEIERITREPVTEEELQRAKDIELNQLVFDLSTKSAVLNRKAFYDFYGYPPDFLERYQERVASLTADDLLAAAQKHIRPDEMASLVVGVREDFVGEMEDLGTVTQIDITIPEPPTRFTVPEPTEESLARGRAILEAAAQAHGGDALERAGSIQIKGSGTLSMMGQQMGISYAATRVLPDRVWTNLNIGGMFDIVTVVDGEGGWRKTPQGLMDLSGEDLEEGHADLVRSSFYIMTHWEEMTWQALEPRELDGVLCDVVYGRDAPVKEWLLFFDADTHLLRGMDYRGRGRAGPVQAAERFAGHRSVDGVQVAYQVNVLHDGEPVITLEMTEATVGGEIDGSIFTRPEQ